MLHSLKKRIALWLCPELATPVVKKVPVLPTNYPMEIQILYPDATTMAEAMGIDWPRLKELCDMAEVFAKEFVLSTIDRPVDKKIAYVELSKECHHPNELALVIGVLEMMLVAAHSGQQLYIPKYEIPG